MGAERVSGRTGVGARWPGCQSAQFPPPSFHCLPRAPQRPLWLSPLPTSPSIGLEPAGLHPNAGERHRTSVLLHVRHPSLGLPGL